MDKLNELVVRAKAACDGRAAGYMEKVSPHTILAIAEAFRELEQRAEAAEADNRNYSELLSYHIDRQAKAEAKLAELNNQKADGFVSAPRKAKLFYHGESLPVDTKLFTRPAPAAAPECKWTYDEHDYFWQTSCGEGWQFTDGDPEENRVKFCQGCGGVVRQIEGLK